MDRIEVLSKQVYDYSEYQIECITDATICKVILKDFSKTPYGICSVITYQNIGETIASPLLSWHNLFFCSNNYGVAPNCDYMNTAVQKGLKTAATAYVDCTQFKKLCSTLPVDCHAIPYESDEENMTMAFIYRNGTLDDIFGLDRIQGIYQSHGITDMNWHLIKDDFYKPLSYFGNSANCGFDLQNGGGKESLVLTGLILGYPVESTIAWLKGDVEVFPTYPDSEVRHHFKEKDNPIVDTMGRTWFKADKHIFCNGQQENIYY